MRNTLNLTAIAAASLALAISLSFRLRPLPPPEVFQEGRQWAGQVFRELSSMQRMLYALEASPLTLRRRLIHSAHDGSSSVWREINARMALLEEQLRKQPQDDMGHEARVRKLLVEVEFLRARILNVATSPLARTECYRQLLSKPGSAVHFDAEVKLKWLRDVYSEDRVPAVARSLAFVAGRLEVDSDIVGASLHLCNNPDDATRRSAVAGIARVLGSDYEGQDVVIGELKRIAQYDQSSKVRSKAFEELGRIQ